jgi:hypothetical protein
MKREMLRDHDGSSLHHATSGFALAALVVATVAVVVPEVDAIASSEARGIALADTNAIGAALRRAIGDLGDPRESSAGLVPEWFVGPGVLPRGAAVERPCRFPLSGVLASDRLGAGGRWRGPYLSSVPIDPWGRAYVVMPCGPGRDAPTLVVSAGADGVLDSVPGRRAIADGDVGIVLMP